jgi:protein gp37
MQKTKIEYLTYTWNPIAMRCSPVSPGCKHCWHLSMANRLKGNPSIAQCYRDAYAGVPPSLRTEELDAPLRLREPARIGVQFMGDLFHEAVHDEWVHLVVAIASMAPQHRFLFLTKRPERARALLSGDDALDHLECAQSLAFEEYGHHVYDTHARRRDDGLATAWMFSEGLPPNICLGVSVERPDQLWRVEELLKIPAAVRWVSYEPALGMVDLDRWLGPVNPALGPDGADCGAGGEYPGIHWIAAGPETGPSKRPADLDWFRLVRDQCQAAGVPFFYKGGLLDGRRWEETP